MALTSPWRGKLWVAVSFELLFSVPQELQIVIIGRTDYGHDMRNRANSSQFTLEAIRAHPGLQPQVSTMPSSHSAQSAKGPEATGSQGRGTHQR
ncbi:predicted protein [Pyrenophora tritici-repentis Pt-1C-BFP]|uniref:Uncharacterized protein n=2 Tax=Pyrenophora tritici-repentis TaxID=45151 RepID=B2WN94_PYRTR|nr:uncharacterized protein PTRG_11351 [Pyrenophora tritici-repentis Pt-1C-BFP]EDU44401.1 predicted protein [Pyrenophora tritici-repentis Pt-1C-BFP]